MCLCSLWKYYHVKGFELRFFSQECIFRHISLVKGNFFLLKSLWAKGIFKKKKDNLRICVLGLNYHLFWEISLTKGIFGLKFLKITWEWAHDQVMVLSHGYVFDQISLSQGYPIQNRSRTPHQNFLQYPLPPTFGIVSYSENAWACDLNGITQRGRLVDGCI